MAFTFNPTDFSWLPQFQVKPPTFPGPIVPEASIGGQSLADWLAGALGGAAGRAGAVLSDPVNLATLGVMPTLAINQPSTVPPGWITPASNTPAAPSMADLSLSERLKAAFTPSAALPATTGSVAGTQEVLTREAAKRTPAKGAGTKLLDFSSLFGAPQTQTFTIGSPSKRKLTDEQIVNRFGAIESSGDPTATNPHSSATGLHQFTDDTFMDFAKAKHPEWLRKMTPEQILARRTDESVSKEAATWYLGEGRKTLGKLGLDDTPGNLYLHHFLGPGGLARVTAAGPEAALDQLVPNAVASNPILAGKTVGWLQNWAGSKFGESGMPQPPMAGAPPAMAMPGAVPVPPAVGAPPQQAMPVGPNFAPFIEQLKGLGPKPVDAEALQKMKVLALLGGLAQGAGSVAPTVGNTGRIIAAAGGAGTGGLGSATQYELEAKQKRDELARQHGLTVAGVGMEAEKSRAQYGNLGQETAFRNQMATYGAQEATKERQYKYAVGTVENENLAKKIDFENKKAAQTVTEENKERQYKFDALKWQTMLPHVDAKGENLIVTQKDEQGNLKVQLTPLRDSKSQLDSIVLMNKALGDNDATAQAKIYGFLLKNNPQAAPLRLIQDIVDTNVGPAIFGQKDYDTIVKAAEAEVKKTPGAALLQSNPVKYRQEVNQLVQQKLYTLVAQRGKTDWIEIAAANGVPGAQLLAQFLVGK